MLFLLGAAGALQAQPPLFTDALPKEEFAARRARVMEQIGDAVVVVQGTTETSSYEKFRQSNQFFYLSGIEVPRAILVIDGRAKRSALYIAPKDERMERSEGPLLAPGPDAERLTGIEQVLPREQFIADAKTLDGRVVYTTLRGETVGAGTPDREASHKRAREADPWDQRPSREDWFMKKLGAQAKVEFRNLDPILDAMRMIKSPREIALIRESTRIAGQGLMEAMRSAEPGMYEYELEAIADYVFKKNNAQGIAVLRARRRREERVLAALPRVAGADPRRRAGAVRLRPRLQVLRVRRDADVPDQRQVHRRPARALRHVREAVQRHHDLGAPRKGQRDHAEIVAKMDAVLASTTFANPKNKDAATRFVEGYRTRAQAGNATSLGHMVGMEVHDVTVPFDELKPGMIFTIEPAMTIPDDRVYIRLEDVLLVTPDGYENLSAFAPIDPDAVEKLMAEHGFAEKRSQPTAAVRDPREP